MGTQCAYVDARRSHLSGRASGFSASAAALIQELCRRYQPGLVGELRAKIAPGGVELTGHGIKLDVKRQDTGAVVASLDIPVSLKIRVDELAVTLQDATIKLDVIK